MTLKERLVAAEAKIAVLEKHSHAPVDIHQVVRGEIAEAIKDNSALIIAQIERAVRSGTLRKIG